MSNSKANSSLDKIFASEEKVSSGEGWNKLLTPNQPEVK